MAAGGFAAPKLRQRWQGVILGLDAFSPEDLAELWDPEASEWRPAQWLAAWQESLASAASGEGG
jgi:hypothetical protein